MSFDHVTQGALQRYSARFQTHGGDVKSLGWGSADQQQLRFEQTLLADPGGKSVLDIGCGFGDYYDFLQGRVDLKSYTGWEINPDLLGVAKTRHTNAPARFEAVNLLDAPQGIQADVGVMLGLLNYRLRSDEENLNYSKTLIEKAFDRVGELLIVDFLSTHLTPGYPPESWVFYHNPAQMLGYALTLTPRVILHHNYAPIPQREFMLFLYKETA